MAESTTEQPAGVQQLIDRIRNEGTSAARSEAEKIVADAKAEAARLVAAAKAEAEAVHAKAKAAIESEEQAAIESLKTAARDTILQLQATVRGRFEEHVSHLVSKHTEDRELMKSIILVIAGESADKYIKDKDARVILSTAMLGDEAKDAPDVEERMKQVIFATAGDVLREGIELVPSDDVSGGARIQLVGENLEIDLTDKAITRLISRRLLPRYRKIAFGED